MEKYHEDDEASYGLKSTKSVSSILSGFSQQDDDLLGSNLSLNAWRIDVDEDFVEQVSKSEEKENTHRLLQFFFHFCTKYVKSMTYHTTLVIVGFIWELLQFIGLAFNEAIPWTQDMTGLSDLGEYLSLSFALYSSESLLFAFVYLFSITFLISFFGYNILLVLSYAFGIDSKLTKIVRGYVASILLCLYSIMALPLLLNLLGVLGCRDSNEISSCWSGQHLVASIISMLSLIVYIPSGLLITWVAQENSMVSPTASSSSSSFPDNVAFISKIILGIVFGTFTDKWVKSIAYTLCMSMMYYCYYRYPCYHYIFISKTKFIGYSVGVLAGLCTILSNILGAKDGSSVLTLFLVLIPAVCATSYVALELRFQRVHKTPVESISDPYELDLKIRLNCPTIAEVKNRCALNIKYNLVTSKVLGNESDVNGLFESWFSSCRQKMSEDPTFWLMWSQFELLFNHKPLYACKLIHTALGLSLNLGQRYKIFRNRMRVYEEISQHEAFVAAEEYIRYEKVLGGILSRMLNITDTEASFWDVCLDTTIDFKKLYNLAANYNCLIGEVEALFKWAFIENFSSQYLRAIYSFYLFVILHDEHGASEALEEAKDMLSRNVQQTGSKSHEKISSFFLSEQSLTFGFRVDDEENFGVICSQSVSIPPVFSISTNSSMDSAIGSKKADARTLNFIGVKLDTFILQAIYRDFLKTVEDALNGEGNNHAPMNEMTLLCRSANGHMIIPNYKCCILLEQSHLTPQCFLSIQESARKTNTFLINKDNMVLGATSSMYQIIQCSPDSINSGSFNINSFIRDFDRTNCITGILSSRLESDYLTESFRSGGSDDGCEIEYFGEHLKEFTENLVLVHVEIRRDVTKGNLGGGSTTLHATWMSLGVGNSVLSTLEDKKTSKLASKGDKTIERELEKVSNHRKASAVGSYRSSIKKLHWIFSIGWGFAMAFCFAIYLYNVIKFSNYLGYIDTLNIAADRDYRDISLAYYTRGLELNYRGTKATPSSAQLIQNADEAARLVGALQDDVENSELVKPQIGLMNTPSFNVDQIVHQNVVTSIENLKDSLLLTKVNADEVTTLSSFSSDTPSAYFIYQNCPSIILEKLQLSNVYVQDEIDSQLDTQKSNSIYMTVACIVGLMILIFSILPAILEVEKTNQRIFDLIIDIPTETAKSLKHSVLRAKVSILWKSFEADSKRTIATKGVRVSQGKAIKSKNVMRNAVMATFVLFIGVVVIYLVLLYILSYIVVANEVNDAPTLFALASSRSYRTRLSLYLAREYFINLNGNFLTQTPRELCIDETKDLGIILEAIAQGNNSMSLPKELLFNQDQTNLMTGTACLSGNSATCGQLYGGVVNQGLYPSFQTYISQVQSFAFLRDPATNETYRKAVLNDAVWTDLETFESEYLQPGIEKSNQYYHDEFQRQIQNSIIYQTIVFVIFVIGSLVYYSKLYLPTIKKLTITAKYSKMLLFIIPKEILLAWWQSSKARGTIMRITSVQ
eukprot:Nk52_evm19s270 gene=Nk52_evmTU19s270